MGSAVLVSFGRPTQMEVAEQVIDLSAAEHRAMVGAPRPSQPRPHRVASGIGLGPMGLHAAAETAGPMTRSSIPMMA
jgi:hypothetical protein